MDGAHIMATLSKKQPPQVRRILVVETDPARALAVAMALADDTTSVVVARTEGALVRAIEDAKAPVHAAVVSWCSGAPWTRLALGLLHEARQPCAALVLVDDPDDADALIACGHHEFAMMPAPPTVVAAAVDRVAAATARIRTVLGESPARAQRARSRACAVVPVRAPVALRPPVTPPKSVPPKERPRPPTLRGTFEHAVEALARRVALSRRERSVLKLLVMGCAYPEIGRELSISARTVKMHAANLRLKTGVGSRSDLVRTLFAS